MTHLGGLSLGIIIWRMGAKFPFSLWSKNSLGGPAYDFEKYVVINGNWLNARIHVKIKTKLWFFNNQIWKILLLNIERYYCWIYKWKMDNQWFLDSFLGIRVNRDKFNSLRNKESVIMDITYIVGKYTLLMLFYTLIELTHSILTFYLAK